MERIYDGIFVAMVHVNEPERVKPLLGGSVQVVRAMCWEEVVFAAVLSVRAFERGTNRARTLGGELLLRLAGRLQISEAIAEHGLAEGPAYLVVFGTEAEAKRVIESLGLEEMPPEHCTPEAVKPLFEKSAMVEAL